MSNDLTGTGIAQVRLDLTRFPAGIGQTIFTDSNGHASFVPIAVGRYVIRAAKDGYQDAEVPVDTRRQETALMVEVVLQPKQGKPDTPGTSISARALSVPEPARNEFTRGLDELNGKKNPRGQIEHFEKAVALYPDYYEAYFLLGIAHLETTPPDRLKAGTALRKAIELNPKFLYPYYPLADLLIGRQQYDEAEKLLQTALQQDQQSWKWPFELALCYAKGSQWEKAITYGQMALSRPNPPTKVHLLMADLYSNTGNAEKAIEELEKFSNLDPSSPFMPRVRQVLEQLRKQKPN